MAKYTEFYKGRRKRRNYVFIPAAILIGLLAFAVVMFYGVQKGLNLWTEGDKI